MPLVYRDYFWKNGRPIGKQLADSNESATYKIISDPYFKHISVEAYNKGTFDHIVYDSRLLDFRSLRQELPPSWEKKEEKKRVLIRNQDDRIVWIETYKFERERCRVCYAHSPHGVLLSIHKVYYTELGDAMNGIELFDSKNKIVMRKIYQLNSLHEFGELLEENWSIENRK